MKYIKPEVKTLGEAVAIIQNPLTKDTVIVQDGVKPLILTPAYDLDE
jgi:hypothetical protein